MVVLQLDQTVTLQNHDQVQVMVLMVWMQYIYQTNLLNQEIIAHACIRVGITQHLTHMRLDSKYDKSILEILNDNIYFTEKIQEWYMEHCIHRLDNKHEVRTYPRPITNMQETSAS